MSNKNTKTAGEAIAASPAPAVNQTADTAAEAGSPIVPTNATASDEAPEAKSKAELVEELATLTDAQFEEVFEAVLAEADRRGIITTDEPQAESVAVAEVRDLLTRNGLKKAWQDAAGNVHFDETAALKAADGNADSLTVIEA